MRRFTFTLVLLAACAQSPARVIVTAPKRHLTVGETVILVATLSPHHTTDSLRRDYDQEFIWEVRKAHSGFNMSLMHGIMKVERPDTATICARHWFSYKPESVGVKKDLVHLQVEDGCVTLTSGPAK